MHFLASAVIGLMKVRPLSSRSFHKMQGQSTSCPSITMVLSTSAGTRKGAAERRIRKEIVIAVTLREAEASVVTWLGQPLLCAHKYKVKCLLGGMLQNCSGLCKAAWVTPWSHGQPCSWAHCRTARWPCLAASMQVFTALLAGPLQYRQVASHGCIGAHLPVPGATLLAGPLQYGQAAPQSCIGAHTPVPGPAMLPHPLQCGQLASLGGLRACVLLRLNGCAPHKECLMTAPGCGPGVMFLSGSGATLAKSPLQHSRVPFLGCS